MKRSKKGKMLSFHQQQNVLPQIKQELLQADWHVVVSDDNSYHYGSFLGGDPRTFHPDPECSEPYEVACWEEACIAADRIQVGVPQEIPTSRYIEDGDRQVHIQAHRYGLGTQHTKPGPWREWLKDIRDKQKEVTDGIPKTLG